MAQSRFAGRFPEATMLRYPTTAQSLMTHYHKFGLDNSHTGYKGKAETYASYKKLREDALVFVAISELSEDAYVQILELIGYGRYESAARADWQELHSEQEPS